MRRNLVIFFTVFIFSLNAQTKNKVYIQVSPLNSIIKLNNELINIADKGIPFTLELEKGEHIIEIWAPDYEKIKDTIIVGDRKTSKYFKKLSKRTEKYDLYRKELKEYRAVKAKKIVSNIVVPSAILGVFWYSLGLEKSKELSPLKEKTELYREMFSNSISQESINNNRFWFETFRKEYNKKRKELYLRRSIGIPLSIVGSYFSFRFLKKVNNMKKEKPVYSAEKSPFVLKKIDYSYERTSHNLCLIFQF